MGETILSRERFFIQVDEGLFINGEVKTVADGIAKPVLIISHGFKGHKDWGFWPEVSDRFAAQGFYTVVYNFSRISASSGSLSEEEAAAASTVTQELIDLSRLVGQILEVGLPYDKEADPSRIALLGHSRSGSSSLIFAAGHEEIRAVAVWNGGRTPQAADQLNEEATPVERAVNEDNRANKEKFNIVRHFSSLKVPALIVQGDQDNAALLESNKQLREAAPEQTFVDIAGGNHTFGASEPYEGASSQLDQAVEVTLRFLKAAY